MGHLPIGLGGLKGSRPVPIKDEVPAEANPSRLYDKRLGLRGRLVGTGLEVVRERLTGVEPPIDTPRDPTPWP